MLTKPEIDGRIGLLRAELEGKGLDGALFVYPIDVYYFTGTRQNAALWVPSSGEPLLFVRKSLVRAREEALTADIRPFPSGKDFPGLFPETVRRIGFTFDAVPAAQLEYYRKLLPGREFVDISAINRDLRSVKSAWELKQMRFSGARVCDVFRTIPQFLKAGMRELDLAAEVEYRLRKAGSEGYVRMRAFNQELFQGLAVSGSAECPGFFDGAVTGAGLSAASPHGASVASIQPNAPVVVDYTGIFNGYIVDMTRMFTVGALSPELMHAFDVALAIQQAIADRLKPGAVCEELFQMAQGMANEAGLAANFMGAPGENARFVGHGVGLELDEFPVLAQGFKVPLKEGQTIAVEPKFVFPGQGVIGIENTFAVAAGGGEKLTDLSDDIVFV